MMEDNLNVETTNINLQWLDNVFKQITALQDIERLMREGCASLLDYLQIPPQMAGLILPEAQYKNMRFMVMELGMLIKNIQPIIPEKISLYEKRLELISKYADNRKLFISETKSNNSVVALKLLPLFDKVREQLIKLKGDIILDLSPVLYIKDDKKKKW